MPNPQSAIADFVPSNHRKMNTLLKIFLITNLILNVSSGQPSDADSRIREPVEYRISDKCNGTHLIRPEQLEPSSTSFQDCFMRMSKSKDNSEDELPVLEWKTYLCVLNESSVFSDERKTNFDSYFEFMTEKYPKNISDEIKSESKNCSKPDEKLVEPWEKVLSYAECFFRSQKQFCHDKFYEDVEPVDSAETKCEPLAGLYRMKTCCKGKPTPIKLSQLVDSIVLNPTSGKSKTQRKNIEKCKKSFVKRQKQLQKGLNETMRYELVSCETCDYNPTPYSKAGTLDLSVPTQKVDAILKEMFAEKLRTDIKARIKKWSSGLRTQVIGRGQYWRSPKLRLISNEKYIAEFKEFTDELDRIYSYCEYMHFYTRTVETAFDKYCEDDMTVTTVTVITDDDCDQNSARLLG